MSQPKQKTTGELVAGIIGTIDIGSLVANVLNLQIDMAQAETIKTQIIDYIKKELTGSQRELVAFTKTSGANIITTCQTLLRNKLEYLILETHSSLGLSATGSKMASAMRGQEAKIHSALESVDLYSDILFGIPQNFTRTKAERYYNKSLAPNFPNELDAYKMSVNGFWSSADFIELLQEMNGLTLTDAQYVADIRRYTVGKPSLRDAYNMVQKGLKNKSYFLLLAQRGQGWSKTDAEDLYTYYDYDFSPSELMRMSDFVPLDLAWIRTKLAHIGMNTADIEVMVAAIQKRVVRDELSKEYGLFLDNYSWGLISSEDLQTFLTASNFSNSEVAYRLETADLMKDRVRLKLMRDSEIYLYRKDVQDEEQLLTALQSLNIEATIANAIVRNEAAKKGLEWEIPE